MESSTGEPIVPDQPPAPEQVLPPVQVPSLSLDDIQPAAPVVPDLGAVAPATPPTPTPDDGSEPVGFDLGDSGYAETLARESYGRPSAPAPSAPVSQAPGTSYQQPAAPAGPYVAADPFAAQSPYAQNPYAQPYAAAEQSPYAQNPYAQNPYAEQQPYLPVQYTGTATGALTPDQERTWASAAHWSALAASVVGLGFLGPLLVYLIQGPKSAWVKTQAAESLNFEITFIIAMIASFVAMLIVVGFVTVFVFPVIWLIFRIIAAVATAQGRDYRYPVNIRLVK